MYVFVLVYVGGFQHISMKRASSFFSSTVTESSIVWMYHNLNSDLLIDIWVVANPLLLNNAVVNNFVYRLFCMDVIVSVYICRVELQVIRCVYNFDRYCQIASLRRFFLFSPLLRICH